VAVSIIFANLPVRRTARNRAAADDFILDARRGEGKTSLRLWLAATIPIRCRASVFEFREKRTSLRVVYSRTSLNTAMPARSSFSLVSVQY
jgi:hypothetical protein